VSTLRRHNASWTSRFLLALAIVAMAVKAVVPAGYMVARDDVSGRLIVTICSGSGPVKAVLDLTTGAVEPLSDHGPAGNDGKQNVCSFAVAAAPLMDSADVFETVPVELASLDLEPAPSVALLTMPVGPRLPARGPPTLL
jgi:hypothetical protein